jgi:hypothetical protein
MAIDDYANLFDSAGKQYGVDPQLLRSIAQTESSGNPNAYNEESGASGLMQLIPETAKSLGVDDPNDPKQSIPGAAKLLAENIKRYKSISTAVMAYHGGTNPENWGDKTHAYVQKVLGNINNSTSTVMGNEGNDSISKAQSTRDLLAQSLQEPDNNNASSPSKAESTRAALQASLESEDNAQEADKKPFMNINIGEQPKNDPSPAQQEITPLPAQTTGLAHTAGYLARAGLTGISALPQTILNLPTNIASAAKNAYEELTAPEGREALGAETSPFKEPLSSQDFENQLSDIGLQAPADRPERLISDIVQGATGGAIGGGVGAAIGGGLGGGASSYVREHGGSKGQQLAASLAGNLLIPGTATISSTLSKPVNPLLVDAAKKAEALGIKIPNAQLTNNAPVKWLSSALSAIPFSGAGKELEAAKSQWMRRISNTIGEDTPNLTSATMDSAGDRIGKMYDSVAESVPNVKISSKALDKLSNISSKIDATLPPDEATRLNKQIDDIIHKAAANDGSLPIDVWKNFTDSNSDLTDLTKSLSTLGRKSAYNIKGALYDALSSSAPQESQDTLKQANQYYKNYKTLAPLAEKDPITGEINPLLLLNKVNQTGKKFNKNGLSDLQTLAEIGNKFFKQMPSSGTAERAALMGYLGAGGAGGVAEHLLSGNIPQALGTVGNLAATSLAARGANAAINSQAYRNMLLGNNPNYLPGILGGVASNQLRTP